MPQEMVCLENKDLYKAPVRTILKVTMKRSKPACNAKEQLNYTEDKVIPTKTPKPVLRTKANSAGMLQVPRNDEKRIRRLSDSLMEEKEKQARSLPRRRSVSFDPYTIFKTGIMDNDVDSTRSILESGKVTANTSVDGVFPILVAAKDGCAECLQLLIDHGAEIDVLDRHGFSPLEIAVREGHFDCAQVLISAGANAISIRDGYFDDTIESRTPHTPNGRSRSKTF